MGIRSALVAGLAAQAGAVWLAGVNIAGCEIGMDTEGNFSPSSFDQGYQCPSVAMATSQIQHFANNDGFNVFRLPVPWQKLVNNDLVTNKLDSTFFAQYNQLVQICLDSSANAHCIIDIHNYGRWWGGIVGQGGAGADTLAKTWSQIASHWASQPRIMFGTMNEPHDQDDNTWAATLQTVVYAIRDAGATSQIILLSPTNYANAIDFPNHASALLNVKNRDGSTTNLIFELHQYFDMVGGKVAHCNDTELPDKFRTITGAFLQQHNRQAFIGELGGGGSDQECQNLICASLDQFNNMGDQFLGWTSWAAGNWWPQYELTEVPTNGVDVPLVANCFAPKFKAGQ